MNTIILENVSVIEIEKNGDIIKGVIKQKNINFNNSSEEYVYTPVVINTNKIDNNTFYKKNYHKIRQKQRLSVLGSFIFDNGICIVEAKKVDLSIGEDDISTGAFIKPYTYGFINGGIEYPVVLPVDSVETNEYNKIILNKELIEKLI